MNDSNDDVHEILNALKYASSDRLKAAQSKFTSARNTISDEALSYPYKSFFSPAEQETLQKAANILGEFKNKIEHAKEIRGREERKREMHLNQCKARRCKLLEKYFLKPVSMQDHYETVLFHLALQNNSNSIAPGAFFGHGIRYVESDLDRGLDAKYSHLEVKHVAMKCWRESTEWLETNLWRHDVIPDAERIEKVLQVYQEQWRSVIEKFDRHSTLLERYKQGLQAEFDTDAAKAREKVAFERRSTVKLVK